MKVEINKQLLIMFKIINDQQKEQNFSLQILNIHPQLSHPMKAKQTKNANIGLQQNNSIIQAWYNLKDSIFNVLFVLLDSKDQQEQQSLWGLAFESGLDYLQMMAFPFNTAVISVWNGGQTLQSATAIFTKLNISSYLPGVSFSAFLVFLYLLIALIVLVIIDIIYVSYSFSKKKFRFTWPLVLLAQIVPLFVTVFFLPMTETLLNVVQCNTTDSGYQVMQSFPDVICWEGWHLFHAAVTLLFTSIFVFISSIVALALFEPRMTTNKLTARQNSTAQVVFIMDKVACQFIFSFTPFNDTWIYCVILFGFAFWQFWCYMVNQPYYNKKASKFFKVVSAYYFWTCLMLMVSQILLIWNFNGGLVIWLGGLPFLFIIILFERKSNISKLFSSNLKFRSGEQIQSHITYNQKRDKNSYMLLIGYIEKHKEICTEEDCPFSKYLKKKRKYGQNEMQDNIIQLLKQLQRMYRIGIKRYPKSTKLRLSFAFFHLERTKNKNKAFQEFTNAQQTDPSFEQQFIIYRFKKIIKQNLQDDEEGGNNDLIEMIRFDNHISLCEQAMIMSARLHKQFWAELKQQIPHLKKLNSIGSKITQTGNAVKQNYHQLSKINSSVPQILHNYAIYLLLIIEDYTEGRQLLANSKKLYQDKLTGEDKLKDIADEGFSDKVMLPILVISRNQDKLGKIINCNLMLTQITGFYKQQLCDRDFHKLLPQTYVAAHEFTLNDWAKRQNANSTYFNTPNEGFIKQKSGLIVPVTYNVKYNIVEEQFLVNFKLDTTRTTKCLLLADSMGMIKQYSAIGKNLLKFQPNGNIDSGCLYLEQIGLRNYQNDQFKQGTRKALRIDDRQTTCMVKVKPIVMKMDFQLEDGFVDQSAQLLQAAKQTIGYIVQITPVVSYQKSHQSLVSEKKIWTKPDFIQHDHDKYIMNPNNNHHNHHYSSTNYHNNNDDNNNMINEKLLELYKKPQIGDLLITQFAQTKRDDVVLRQFQLKQKIKTMRLMNNQIKMVYNSNDDKDYNSGRQGLNFDDERQMFRFDDQGYQAKLRKAINTNINHMQITRLKYISLVFVLLLFGFISVQLVFSIDNMNLIQTYVTNVHNKGTEMQYLTKFIAGTLSPLYDKNTYFNQVFNYNVTFDSNLEIQFKVEGSDQLETKNLKDVLILMHSSLLEAFSGMAAYTLNNVYYNFVNFVYDAFTLNPVTIIFDILTPFLFFGLTVGAALFMIGFWIYICLLLQKKKYDIMIWFLDIPIPYVSHLSSHCDKYLKQFIGIKQLMQKSANLQQVDQAQFQQYDQKHQDTKQQQIQQQIKVRKSLIAKHRKQTLLSKLNFGYLSMFWLLVYACIMSVLLLSTMEQQINNYQFLHPQWVLTTKQVYWASTLPICMLLRQKQEVLGNKNLTLMIDQLKLNHLNYVQNFGMVDFNRIILGYSADLSSMYMQAYYQSLCNLITTTSSNSSILTECQSIVDSKLRAGYFVYSKYLVGVDDSLVNQIRIANQKYVIPVLMGVLTSWENVTKTNISSAVSLCSILLYVYIIITSFGFLVFWLMYLKKMNTQLNQTIQMLNMIPFKLLPKSRKQTKQFITWIIKQANKKKHQSQ